LNQKSIYYELLSIILYGMYQKAANREAELRETLAAKERLLAEKEAEIERLRQRIHLLEKALFGPRSERIIQDPEQQGKFDELLREVDELSRQLDRAEEQLQEQRQARRPKRRNKRRNLDELIPEGLREEEIVIDLPEEEKISLETGKALVKIREERTRKLAVKPPEYYVKVFVIPGYVDPDDPKRGVVSAGAPDHAIPGGTFDESFIADVVADKCAMHLPLYRQEERLHNLGIEVSRQTLSRLYMKAAEVLLPVYLLMKEAILARKIIFTDDTPVRLQVPGNRKTVTGRMWVYIGGGNGPPFRVFEFTRDRCKKRPKEFLGDFKGYIHADAYKGYDDLFARDGVHECACWMHVRRKYVDARDAPVQLRDSVLRAIRHIFRYDRFARNHPDNSDELILAVRHEKIAPLIDWLFARTARALKEGEVLPGSAFAAAIGYMHGLDEALRTFLNHAQLMPDNGQSERAIRPLAIGRRNWLFAGSKRGGDATGVLLSIVQSCRAAGLDPFTYLQDVLRRINGHSANRIHELLPTKDWKPAETYYG
jgi:transposase